MEGIYEEPPRRNNQLAEFFGHSKGHWQGSFPVPELDKDTEHCSFDGVETLASEASDPQGYMFTDHPDAPWTAYLCGNRRDDGHGASLARWDRLSA